MPINSNFEKTVNMTECNCSWGLPHNDTCKNVIKVGDVAFADMKKGIKICEACGREIDLF